RRHTRWPRDWSSDVCSSDLSANNYGPFQFPEKLIPLMLRNSLAGEPLPVYGDGAQVRDWLYVEDNCDALVTILDRAQPGRIYNRSEERRVGKEGRDRGGRQE